jgi:hypothetical protein
MRITITYADHDGRMMGSTMDWNVLGVYPTVEPPEEVVPQSLRFDCDNLVTVFIVFSFFFYEGR